MYRFKAQGKTLYSLPCSCFCIISNDFLYIFFLFFGLLTRLDLIPDRIDLKQ